MTTIKLWSAGVIAALLAGGLAGCGTQQASSKPTVPTKTTAAKPVAKATQNEATPQIPMSAAHLLATYSISKNPKPEWSPGKHPLNVAALIQYAHPDFPDLVANAPGAPKTPPFSLAAYPAQHSISWGFHATLNDWAVTGAETAAQWFMADQGNHPMNSWKYIDAQERVQSNTFGITNERQAYIRSLSISGFTGGYFYEYRTWAKIIGVGNGYDWTHMGFHTPPAQFLGKGQTALHMEEVTVTVYQISAGGTGKGGYEYSSDGPIDILMADIQGQGWKVLDTSSAQGTGLKHFLQTYSVPKAVNADA